MTVMLVQNREQKGLAVLCFLSNQPADNVKKYYHCESPDHLISNCPVKKAKEGKEIFQVQEKGMMEIQCPYQYSVKSPKTKGINTCKARLPLIVKTNKGNVKE